MNEVMINKLFGDSTNGLAFDPTKLDMNPLSATNITARFRKYVTIDKDLADIISLASEHHYTRQMIKVDLLKYFNQ